MATLQKLTDDFLTCIICQGVFKDPVTLHCGHSFCNTCLTSYVLSRPDAQVNKNIPCPHCRSLTQVPDPSRPVEEWAGQLKTGFFVKGLVDTFVTEDAFNELTLCSVCKEGGDTTPADKWCTDCKEALCSKCLDLHKQYPKFREHNTSDIEEGLRQEKAAKLHNCSEHKDEKLKIFCKDCDIAICQLCCSVVHRKCESVITLSEAYSEMKHDLSNKVLDMHFDSLKSDSNLTERKSQLTILMGTCDEAMSELDAACEAFIKSITTKQEKLRKKIRQETDKAARFLTADMESADIEVRRFERDVVTIQSSIQSDSEIELYNVYKRFCSKKNPDMIGDDKAEKDEKRVTEINFKSNTDKLNKNLNSLNLGAIDIVYEEVDDTDDARSEADSTSGYAASEADPETQKRGRPKKPHPKQRRPNQKAGPRPSRSGSAAKPDGRGMHSRFTSKEDLSSKDGKTRPGNKVKKDGGEAAPVLVDHIEIKADIDRLDPQIDDLVTVQDGDSTILVLSDVPNRKVKSLYLKNNQKLFVEFQHPPGGITQVSDNEVAVSVGLAFRIYIMRLRPHLQIVSHIDTKVAYNRICALDGKRFAAVSPGSKSIDILDSNGSLSKRLENENIIRPFLYRTTSPGQVLVSDPEKHAVLKMSINNKTVFKFEPFGIHRLVSNYGASMDNKGNVLVVNRGGNKVVMVNGEGKFVRIVLSLDFQAQKLAYVAIDKKNRMYLTFEDRDICVYQL